jgi:predicted dehydrogenase
VNKREPLARELEAFLAGVRGEPLPDPRVALASLRLAEEATASILATAARERTA